MADTFTTQLNLTKVGIGESEDTWGTKLNDNWDDVDGLFDAGPYLKVANGGTGAGTAATARTALGLGTVATQAADAVALTGGTITGAVITHSSAAPRAYYRDTDLAVDAGGLWYVGTEGDAFQVYRNAAAGGDFSTATAILYATTGGLTFSGNTVWHAGNDGAGSTLDSDLLDGQQGAYYQNASNLNAGSIPAARVPTAAVTQYQSSLTISEIQITDGSVLARVGSNETITGTYSFTSTPGKTGGGKFLHYASSTQSSGSITVSTSTPSGTPAAGDRWVQYVA